MIQRRDVVSAGLWGATAMASPAFGQALSARPIQIVVPVAVGGGTDLLARTLGQKLSEVLGQTVLIDNKLGAGGNIGAEFVMKAKPDGQTLLITPGTIATNVAAYRKLPYDLTKDFQAITLIGQTPSVLVVHPGVKANTVKEFAQLLRSQPGILNFGSAGTGSPHHLHSEFFNQLIGAKSNHIPYKGQSQAMNDLLGGQIQYLFSPLQNALQQIQQGRVRALGVASAQRSTHLPNVPTFIELGYKEMDLVHWFAVLAPANMPTAILQKLSAAFAKIGNQAETKDKLTALGFETRFTNPAQTMDFMRAELVRWARVAAYAGIQPE
jgi:tripartite-type tricarboxylate transporter receptor subunit TctC